jgi:hypothetical protein
MADIPIAIDDPVKDEGIIRDRLMDELCKSKETLREMVNQNRGV